jgi:1-acyl-sn-glycerol-3-phosphate acyltransferase
VPCAIFGTDQVQPSGKLMPRVHRVQVVFGAPLDFSRYTGPDGAAWRALAGTPAQGAVVRAVTDEIMDTLRRMTGREYVDVYASSLKQRLKKTPDA